MKLSLIFIVLIFVLVSCEKSPKCWGKTTTVSGIVESDTTLCSNCTILTNENEGFVINSQLDLNKLYYRNFGNNGLCELNEFNFEKYSLLGMTTLTTCKYQIDRNVTIDDAEKTYYYDIYIDECGNCQESYYHPNWVLIPKIKSGYKVIFRTSRN